MLYMQLLLLFYQNHMSIVYRAPKMNMCLHDGDDPMMLLFWECPIEANVNAEILTYKCTLYAVAIGNQSDWS